MKRTNLDGVPQPLRHRTWYRSGDAYAFLVDAPITLGHSQLRVTVGRRQPEEQAFKSATAHAANCIEILRATLSALAFDKWAALARYTGTSGRYTKTLVLKVSAKEPRGEYKIHLVPYFSSHLHATTRLHTLMQGRKSTGGLLHWVGQRERIVDYDVRDGRQDPMAVKRITSFKLRQLAAKLRHEHEKRSQANASRA